MIDRVGVRRLMSSVRQTVPRWADRLPELPGLTVDIFDQIKSGRLKVQTHDPQLAEIRREIHTLHRRMVLALIGVGFVICSAILFDIKGAFAQMIGPFPLSVWIFGALGVNRNICGFDGTREIAAWNPVFIGSLMRLSKLFGFLM